MSSNIPHLSWRAAIKKYDSSKKLSGEQIDLLIEAARMAPTSYGLQALKLYITDDQKIKDQLKTAGYNQAQYSEASHVLVFAVRENLGKKDVDQYMERVAKARDQKVEDLNNYKEIILRTINSKNKEELLQWSSKQAYIALGMVLDVAAINNIDTTPLEGFEPEKFDQILGIKDEGYRSVVAITAGTRAEDDKYSQMPKVRKTKEEFVKEI